MSSNVPPAIRKKRGRHHNGHIAKLTPQHKAKRLEIRKRRKTWAARVWAKRHIKGET